LPSGEALCQGQISAWTLVPISLDRSTFFSSQETNPKLSDGFFPEETLNILVKTWIFTPDIEGFLLTRSRNYIYRAEDSLSGSPKNA
jgi:hypothetical protein